MKQCITVFRYGLIHSLQVHSSVKARTEKHKNSVNSPGWSCATRSTAEKGRSVVLGQLHGNHPSVCCPSVGLDEGDVERNQQHSPRRSINIIMRSAPRVTSNVFGWRTYSSSSESVGSKFRLGPRRRPLAPLYLPRLSPPQPTTDERQLVMLSRGRRENSVVVLPQAK